MSEIINSQEYWEKRFSENDWEKGHGREQSIYFAELFKKHVPRWLIEHINKNNMSVVDLGCAEGDGSHVLSTMFQGEIYGVDFSESAVQQAQKTYSNITFLAGDIRGLTQKWDVAFISNVIEHFQDPVDILARVSKSINYHMIVMIPFEEEPRSEEHEVVFSYDNIPTGVEDFRLIYFNNIINFSESDARYRGQQLLLVYSRDHVLTGTISIADSNNIIHRWAHSEDYNVFKNEYLEAKIALSNEMEVSRKLYTQNDQLKVQQELTEEELEAIRFSANQLKNENMQLVQDNSQLNQIINDKNAQLAEQKDLYDNLYTYSCQRDHELTSILNSSSYQFFLKWLKKPMVLMYRVSRKLYRIIKFSITLNFRALWNEFCSPCKKAFRRVQGLFSQREIFKDIAESTRKKRVIVLPPTLDWHMPLFQRPQQLALAYAKKPDTVVIYVTKNIQYDSVTVAEHPKETVWVVSEQHLDKLASALKSAESTVLSLSWTPNKFYCDKINPDKLIYEYIDELEIFHMYGPEMEQDHQELMKRADVTVCTATKLYNQAVCKAKNPIISTNAGDYDFFAKTATYEVNPLIRDIIKPYKCVLGYYGAVAKWFDYELVKTVARMHPEWVWIVVGIDYDKTLGKSGFEKLENIVYIPPQPYKELPSFLTAFDVATIPFLINEITLSTSPVKLFEYMAGGKPILTSRMPECLKYKSVMLYSNAEEFCGQVERILALEEDDPYWTILKEDALANTWDAKTDEILNAIQRGSRC